MGGSSVLSVVKKHFFYSVYDKSSFRLLVRIRHVLTLLWRIYFHFLSCSKNNATSPPHIYKSSWSADTTLCVGERRSPTQFSSWSHPVVDCASDPVEKVGQHFSKVHRLDAQAVGQALHSPAHPYFYVYNCDYVHIILLHWGWWCLS